MKKLPTPVKKELQRLADSLPSIQYKDIQVRRFVKGSSLPEEVLKKKNLDPKKDYVYGDEKDKHQLNHFKKLKKLFLAEKDEKMAWQKVKAYISQITHIYNKDGQLEKN